MWRSRTSAPLRRHSIQRYRRVETGSLVEMACAENNGYHFDQGMEPIPQADKPDF
jgi:hypothetical protein